MPRQTTTGFKSLRAPQGRILPAAAILAITLLAYLPAAWGGFFWDDHASILQNRLIQSPDGVRRIWLTTEALDYFPVTYSALWFEWRLWGDHPAGYHVVNILLHAAGAVLLWRVLRRLNVPGAWLAGVLFAVHPVAAASAGWITELKNVLSMVFYLSSLLAFLGFDGLASAKTGESEGRTSPTYLLSAILFLLALLSKTSVVMLPVVLLLCVWWRRGRISRKDLLRSVPFLALSLALGLVTVWFQWHNAIHGWIVRPEGPPSRIAAAGWIIWFYLYKVLLPAGLCVIYPHWKVDGSSVLAFLPLLLLLGGMVILWARRKSWGRGPFFAAAYFLITLLPVLGFLEMGIMRFSLVADHLEYVAMIGVLSFAAGLLAQSAGPGASRQGTFVLVAAGCVAVLAILTWRRASLYGDEILLWRDNIEKVPAAWGPMSNLGNACSAAGFHDEAIRCLDKAIALDPDQAECYYSRAHAWVNVKDFAKAIRDYDKGISLKGDFAVAYCYRGSAYAQTHDLAKAIQDYDKAIFLDNRFVAAYYNLGCAHAEAHDFAKAIQDYGQAISLDKSFTEAYYNRGWAYAQADDPAEAIQDYDEAISLRKGFVEAYYNRGLTYDRLGRHDKAVRDYSEAIELGLKSIVVYFNRGNAFAKLNRIPQAIADYDAAIALQPDYAEAYCSRADCCLQAQRFTEAIQDYGRAVTLKPDFAAAYKGRAIAYYDLGEFSKARADAKMSEKLGALPDPEFLKALEQAAAPPK